MTVRRIEVLKLRCAGWTRKEIASEIGVSDAEVKRVLADLYRIAGVTNAVLLCAWAKEKGHITDVSLLVSVLRQHAALPPLATNQGVPASVSYPKKPTGA